MQTIEQLWASAGMRNPSAKIVVLGLLSRKEARVFNNFVSAAQCSLPGLFVF